MTLTVHKRYGPLRVVHAYFEPPAVVPRCDLLRLRQMPSCTHGAGWQCSPFETLHVDLTQSQEDLWRGVHPKTRERINRATKRDGLTITRSDAPGLAEVDALIRAYDPFAAERGLARADRDSLEQFRKAGVLSVSKISHPTHGDLVFHAIVVTPGRARGLISVIERSAVERAEGPLLGRANRMLFWDDISHFRRRGIPLYDWGGLYQKGDDPALARIAEFKLGFGGRVVTEYKCNRALSWRGRAFLALRPQLDRWRAFLARRRAGSESGEGNQT